MHVKLTKTMNGFIPTDKETIDWFNKLKIGQVVHSDFKKMRNYGFHKKMFALLNLAYSYWEPGEITSKYGTPEKNFDRFRKDVTILAGFFHTEIRLDGSIRVCADSISFASMDNEEFQKLYEAVLTVLMDKILVNMDRETIEDLMDKFLQFA